MALVTLFPDEARVTPAARITPVELSLISLLMRRVYARGTLPYTQPQGVVM